MPHYDVQLAISNDEFAKLYRGAAQSVRAWTVDGRSIRFPARALISYLQRSGIHGRFRVQVDAEHRLRRIDRIG